MPVQKFRSIEEMNRAAPPPRHETAQDSFDRFARHCARAWRIGARSFPRGVFKFRNVEESQKARRGVSDPGSPSPV